MNQANQANPMVADIKLTDINGVCRGAFELPSDTSLARYLKDYANKNAPVPEISPVRRFAETNTIEKPFLSVIVRTQGKRLQELSDVLLCLMGQRDDDFEIILVGHKVEPDDCARLFCMVQAYPQTLLSRLSYYDVTYGNRTAPLQVGFAAARGEYVVALDDDDLVMDDWTETFKQLAQQAPGRMLHAYSVTQDWDVVPADGDTFRRVRSTSAFDSKFCCDFNVAQQLVQNFCPFMSLAFPAFAVKDLAVAFDESLTTTEDWDFLMRIYGVCGVIDSDKVTSIYRLWKSGGTSYTVRQVSEWFDNYLEVVNKLNKRPYLLDANDVELVRGERKDIAMPAAGVHRQAKLVVSDVDLSLEKARFAAWWSRQEGADINAKDRLQRTVTNHAGTELLFDGIDGAMVRTVVLTPAEFSPAVLTDLQVRIETQSGLVRTLDVRDIRHSNGLRVVDDGLVFLKSNPFIAFVLCEAVSISKITVSFGFARSIPDHYVDDFVVGNAGRALLRMYRGLKNKIHELTHH